MTESGVLIVGGGAAGLSAAVASARLGVPVTLLEADARVGKKILASGNGRCNLTNLAISPSAFNRPEFVEPVLSAYPCDAVLAFFGGLGLLTAPDDEGRVYPVTNAASSVLDVLRLECSHLGVDVRCDFRVVSLSQEAESGYLVAASESGEEVRARSVVVATAGGPLLGGLGHTLIEGGPVLGPIRTDTQPIRGLSGVRARCVATLLADVADNDTGGRAIAAERGELLFRDYGVSGIMIFDLSRYLEKDCVISLDFFPDTSATELLEMLSQRCVSLSWRTAETFFEGMLHDRVARALVRAAGVRPDTPADRLPQDQLAKLLKDFRLRVIGMGDAKQAQVTRGGASVSEFDPATMASRRADGLFAAGEVLDIDGRSGGFNLHWAWASGIVAGEAAARALPGREAEASGEPA